MRTTPRRSAAASFAQPGELTYCALHPYVAVHARGERWLSDATLLQIVMSPG